MFKGDVDYAQLDKIPDKGESQALIVSGSPDLEKISTSYVERHNLTVRMSVRRYARKTNAPHISTFAIVRPGVQLSAAAQVTERAVAGDGGGDRGSRVEHGRTDRDDRQAAAEAAPAEEGMKFRVTWIVLASLALTLVACDEMVEKPKVAQVAGTYEGDMKIVTSLAPDVAVPVPITATVTQSGADVTIKMAYTFGGETNAGEPITGVIDADGDLLVTGNWAAIPTVDETACGTTRATRLLVKFEDGVLSLTTGATTETCGTITVTLTAKKK